MDEEDLRARVAAWVARPTEEGLDALEAAVAGLPPVDPDPARSARVVGRAVEERGAVAWLDDPDHQPDATDWDRLEAAFPPDGGAEPARFERLLTRLLRERDETEALLERVGDPERSLHERDLDALETQLDEGRVAPSPEPERPDPTVDRLPPRASQAELPSRPPPANRWLWGTIVAAMAALFLAVLFIGEQGPAPWRGGPETEQAWQEAVHVAIHEALEDELRASPGGRQIRLRLGRHGEVLEAELLLGSGDPAGDARVLEAVKRVDELPAPTETTWVEEALVVTVGE